MRAFLHRRASIVARTCLFTCLVSCSSAGSGRQGDVGQTRCDDEVGNGPGFFRALTRGLRIDYVPAQTVSELASYSEAVVLGQVSGLIESGVAAGLGTSLAVVQVNQVVKGPAIEVAYVELLHSPAVSTKDLCTEGLPNIVGVWFLESASQALSSPLDEDRGSGKPDNMPLWALVSQQGVIADDGAGNLAHPLEPDRGLWLEDLQDYQSVEEILRCERCFLP